MGTKGGTDSTVQAESGPTQEIRARRRPEYLPPDASRAPLVFRKKLVDRLRAASDERAVTVVAPAGYGKTTLLAQWALYDARPAAWLTIERDHDDAAALLVDIRSSLHEAGLVGDEDAAVRITTTNALTAGVGTLVRDLEGADHGVLVLDEVNVLRSRGSRDVLAELANRLPPTITLAIGSRSDVELSTASLRAQGQLMELTADDLAMTADETAELVAHLGLSLDTAGIDALIERTEGWPAGIYLTLLAMEAAGISSPPEVHGDDRFIADYLREQLFDRLSASRASFLVHTSMLDELTGPLCDFVLERSQSARALEDLERSNLMIIALDRKRRWYRYHHLMREFLLSQLERRPPEESLELHRRAAIWYEEHGLLESAIEHAMAAEDEDRVVRLLRESVRATFADGRFDTVLGWLAWFEEQGRIDRHPGMAVFSALANAYLGDVAAARRWSAVFDAADDLGVFGPLATYARALIAPNGLDQMRVDAAAAQERLTPTSNWYAAAVVTEAAALQWIGDVEAADAQLARGVDIAERYQALPTATFGLAARSTIASDRGDRDSARALAKRAVALVEQAQLDSYATSALPYAVAARAATHAGDPAGARKLLARAAGIRPVLSAALPVISLHAVLEMAHAEVELGEISGARQMLREADAIFLLCGPMGGLEDRYRELKERVASMPAGQIGPAALTNAELRLLPLLATHLSFPEIGERLYVSRHTVKTQAMSIYRKLGASSRSEAVQLARDLYLLDA